MTTAHVATLFFDGRLEAARKRLQKLKAAGVISERPRRVVDSAVVFLTKAGLAILAENGILTEYPSFSLNALERRAQASDLTLRHELSVLDVKAAFHLAIKKATNLKLAEFNTWPLLNQFTAYRNNGAEILVKPDGFIRIQETDADGTFEHTFFLEVDLSTEETETLALRTACYLDFYRSGGFALKNGAARADYKDFPFRVLIVCKTRERRNNLAERLLNNRPPIFTLVWLSVIDDVSADSLGAVWITPAGYRDATKDTPFPAGNTQFAWGYKRPKGRGALVESKIRKLRLIE